MTSLDERITTLDTDIEATLATIRCTMIAARTPESRATFRQARRTTRPEEIEEQ